MTDKLNYENKRYKDLTNSMEKDKLDEIIELLSDIKTEISEDENGSIQIHSDGKISVSNFNSELFEKISLRLYR